MENYLLRKYDYAWNKRRNGGHDGLRPNVLPRDSEDSEESEESEDSDDSEDSEQWWNSL